MATRAHYHPRNIDIDTGNHTSLPTWLFDEIISLHGQISRQDPPVFTCLDNGKPMYVWQHENGRYFLRHYKNENPNGHSHAVNTMSVEHRRQVDYIIRGATNHGLTATPEKSTGNHTRLDAAVPGPIDTGFEVQRSQLSRAHAKRRAKLSFDAGWQTAWITDQERDPNWLHHVPSAQLEVRGQYWADALPPPNTAYVVIGEFTRERDRQKPSGWAYNRQPCGVLLDELSYLMPAGDIVPVATGKEGRVSLAFKEAREIIDSCTYPDASLWIPDYGTPRHKEAAQSHSRACGHFTVDTETCCWLERGVYCACWRCLNDAINDLVPNKFDEVINPTLRCPGCARMHTISPCFPNCAGGF